MSNAAKFRKKAAEFEGLKQFDRAIAAYVASIEESEKRDEEVDVAILNKVGDLTLRQGRVADAVTYYERAVEHYATVGLFNNSIALCNKILRNAPGRSNVYLTLGRVCARKGLRGDATRNFLEYATRMQQEGRLDEGMRALAEVADLMPELTEVQRLVDEHAARAGITLQRKKTPLASAAQAEPVRNSYSDKSADLIFLDVEYEARAARLATPPIPSRGVPPAPRQATSAAPPVAPAPPSPLTSSGTTPTAPTAPSSLPPVKSGSGSLDDVMLFDPTSEEPLSEADVAEGATGPLDGLVHLADYDDGIAPLEGLTAQVPDGEPAEASEGFGWLVPPETIEGVELDVDAGLVSDDGGQLWAEAGGSVSGSHEVFPDAPALEGIVLDDLSLADAADAAEDSADVEALDVFPVLELDRAIASGEVAAREGERVELDELAMVERERVEPEPAADEPREMGRDDVEANATPALAVVAASTSTPAPAAAPVAVEPAHVEPAHIEETAPAPDARPPFRLDPHDFILAGELPPLLLDDAVVDAGLAPDRTVRRPMYTTPSLPIASVAAEANAVAVTRRDALRAQVAETPRDWMQRRRLAEALFEAGEREAALAELETAVAGFAESGDIASAVEVAEELVRVASDRVPYHQKRVELAVRLHDQGRLRLAYLDLADTLVQSGDEGRAHAVYARVLEIDPRDERARSALGAAAPPLPEESNRPDDQFVDLADWLRDSDEPASTRMRMKEPTVSGDEQADFDSLLRHFKEGVSRSLGEEDYESHYDLGVAYKEMGLLDDAIGEFQKALRSRSHRLPAYEALGQCFVEQERYQVASTVLSRALHEPGLTDEHRVGVIYLLAYSSEALQRWDEAKSYYQRVYATDINFRDAASRLAALDRVAR